jgi:hypothetical protein
MQTRTNEVPGPNKDLPGKDAIELLQEPVAAALSHEWLQTKNRGPGPNVNSARQVNPAHKSTHRA